MLYTSRIASWLKSLWPKPAPAPAPVSAPAPDVPSPYKTVTAPRRTVVVNGDLSAGSHLGDSGVSPGSQLPDSNAVHFVSRHGLQEHGVLCPACGQLAARPGEWDKVHPSDNHGEGIACACGVMLFASPDDDLDPVKPGEKYDEAIYHRFVRHEAWKPARHRVAMRAVTLNDWVTIRGCTTTVFNRPDDAQGVIHNLDGGEARVERIEETRAFIALAGNSGIGGSRDLGGAWAWVPLSCIHPMALPSIAIDDRVRVLRGPLKGSEGVVEQMNKGVISLRTDDHKLISANVELIEKTEPTMLI
jgi:hypothetical protein